MRASAPNSCANVTSARACPPCARYYGRDPRGRDRRQGRRRTSMHPVKERDSHPDIAIARIDGVEDVHGKGEAARRYICSDGELHPPLRNKGERSVEDDGQKRCEARRGGGEGSGADGCQTCRAVQIDDVDKIPFRSESRLLG
eukprot:2363910-Pyramimonas_sp.AAC.1